MIHPARGGEEYAAFGPGARTLAITSDNLSDTTVLRLWDVATRRTIGPALSLAGTVGYLPVFSPDGKALVLTGQAAQLWYLDSGRPVQVPLDVSGGAIFFS